MGQEMKTKQNFLIYTLLIMGLFLVFASSCKKDADLKVPTIFTVELTEITQTTALSGGNITDEGGATVSARGVCWGKNPNPAISDSKTEDGNGSGSFNSSISGLEPNTKYYVRAYAINSVGTAYGNELSFTTSEIGIIFGQGVTDMDGNEYITVIIGTQEWMAENLRTTKYKDGTDIPSGHSNSEWTNLTTGAYAILPHIFINGLNSDTEVLETYGALYNWYAVETGNLCPTGWHVPTDEEWTSLTDFAGGTNIAGGKLKSTRTDPDAHPRWNSCNTDATDAFGFSAFPGGIRYSNDGTFYTYGDGHWWSSTEYDAMEAHNRFMFCESITVLPYYNKKGFGFAVRCLKD